MIENCRSCLCLFNNVWVHERFGEIDFIEKNPTGSGKAVFRVNSPCIVIKADRQAPLIWALSQRKCADGAFISFDDHGVHLHIIELKSRVNLGAWSSAVQQFEGMFLTSLAIARLMNLEKPTSVTCYIAMKEEIISQLSASPSPTLLKTAVGKSRTFGDWEYWTSGTVKLPLSFNANLVKCERDSEGTADFGTVQ